MVEVGFQRSPHPVIPTALSASVVCDYLSPMQFTGRSAFLFASLSAFAFANITQAQTNIDFVGQLSYQDLRDSDLSNLWGYTDEFGNEYALMGVNGTTGQTGGISVVDLNDPTDPQEIFFFPGPPSIWREIKVWGDHAYVTTEAGDGGLTIVDLSPLPQSTDLPTTVYMDPEWDTSHSLFIDENGRLFIFGANSGNGGAIMYDLTQDPMAPVELGRYDNWYVHDGYARGDTLYAAHITDGFLTIVDVSDPSSPILLGSQITPNAFTHNLWLDESGDHLFTTDERTNAYVGSYDVSDPGDIQFLDKLQSDPGSGAIPHNTYWLPSGHVVQSYYTYGVTIYDASRPDNLVEVGHYDTSPLEGNGFFGAWGVYPFFTSGRLIISDIEEGLFILDPTYVRACWLEGMVTNAQTGTPVALANITIGGTEAIDETGLDGTYGTGYVEAGSFTVNVMAAGYFPAVVEGMVLANGEVTILNIELDPLPSFPVSGVVRTTSTSDPVEGAQVWLESSAYSFNTTTNEDGTFLFPAVYNATYDFTIGLWGWNTACPSDLVVGGASITGIVVDLDKGFADDFALDLGWTVSTTAARGAWERDIPVGTTYQGNIANPGNDVAGDCGSKAYFTGNGGGGAGEDDVDDGGTLLTSPVFDATGMPDPHVRYRRWFFNGGGDSAPDDAYTFSLSDGTDTVVIQTVTATSGPMSQWAFSNIRIADHLEPTATMRLLAFTADDGPNGHLLEAGFDDFSLVPEGITMIPEDMLGATMGLWPNPASDRVTVQLPNGEEAFVVVLDALGRTMMTGLYTRNGVLEVAMDLPNGSYVVHATNSEGVLRVARMVIYR